MTKHNEIAQRIANAIREGLARKRWSQHYLAQKIGISQSNFCGWTNGKVIPPGDKLINLIEILEVQDVLFEKETLHSERTRELENLISQQSQLLRRAETAAKYFDKAMEHIEKRKVRLSMLLKSGKPAKSIKKVAAKHTEDIFPLAKCNKKGIILFWNAAAEKLFGYTSKEMLGREISFVQNDEKLQLQLDSDSIDAIPLNFCKKDGAGVDVVVSCKKIAADVFVLIFLESKPEQFHD